MKSKSKIVIESLQTLNKQKIPEDELEGTFLFICGLLENNIHYDAIAQMIYESGFTENQQVEVLIDNLNSLEAYHIQPEYKIFKKIRNHVDLSIVQNAYITKQVTDLNTQVDIATGKLTEMKDIKGQIYTEFIAILGIFSALIFGLFGGFDAISNIVQTTFKAGVELPNIMIAISLTLGSLSLLLFSLMQGIKILSKSTLKSCGCSNGQECPHSIFKRHPVMSLNLITLSSIFIVSLLVKLYPENTYSWIDNYFVTYLILVGIGVVFITFMLWFLLKKNKVEDSYH
ncbi:conserved membrane hypothetical protein [Brochothrix thermosphacta]|uniref:hypothetical protein n=1 Tax=Brochothrix thermosphacta TaxID=2756 RepID=UPI000D2A0699|nr:hypothetical protein [Brochothrix thermosphacta]SOC27448.1 conserved membrane hypothetical protein [Brochothrix thermosphacta]